MGRFKPTKLNFVVCAISHYYNTFKEPNENIFKHIHCDIERVWSYNHGGVNIIRNTTKQCCTMGQQCGHYIG